MIEDDNQFLEVTALGSELAWRVMKLWMKSAGRTLNNYQESFTSSADFFADYTIILLFEIKSFAPRHFVYFDIDSTEMGEDFHTATKKQTYINKQYTLMVNKNVTDDG